MRRRDIKPDRWYWCKRPAKYSPMKEEGRSVIGKCVEHDGVLCFTFCGCSAVFEIGNLRHQVSMRSVRTLVSPGQRRERND